MPRERVDRRVRRTRERLRLAMIALVAERGYARTRLDELLRRADVGRSTFYAHFRDKDALFDGALAHLESELRAASAEVGDGRLLPFTRAMLEHVGAHAGARLGRPGDDALLARMRRLLVRLAREDLAARAKRPDVPVDLIAEQAIGSFVSLAMAWVAAPRGRDAAAIDALYRQLVEPGLTRALEG